MKSKTKYTNIFVISKFSWITEDDRLQYILTHVSVNADMALTLQGPHVGCSD